MVLKLIPSPGRVEGTKEDRDQCMPFALQDANVVLHRYGIVKSLLTATIKLRRQVTDLIIQVLLLRIGKSLRSRRVQERTPALIL